MFLIPCPHCGLRNETEFTPGGEAARPRPVDPMALNDQDWADYLFMRRNPKGGHAERWCHSAGCRRWFVILRDTVTHEIVPQAGTQRSEPLR